MALDHSTPGANNVLYGGRWGRACRINSERALRSIRRVMAKPNAKVQLLALTVSLPACVPVLRGVACSNL